MVHLNTVFETIACKMYSYPNYFHVLGEKFLSLGGEIRPQQEFKVVLISTEFFLEPPNPKGQGLDKLTSVHTSVATCISEMHVCMLLYTNIPYHMRIMHVKIISDKIQDGHQKAI